MKRATPEKDGVAPDALKRSIRYCKIATPSYTYKLNARLAREVGRGLACVFHTLDSPTSETFIELFEEYEMLFAPAYLTEFRKSFYKNIKRPPYYDIRETNN